MKILLTGANGFTGIHFANLARNSGHEIVPFDTDLTDQKGVLGAVLASAPDAVVHLAGIAFVGHSDDAAFYAVNVVGTCNLLAALTQLPRSPQCVLLASSANVYGNCISSPIVETQAPAPVNHYAASKLAMEHMALTYLDRLPVVIVRPFNYTGPGQHLNFVIPKLVDHFVRRASSVSLGNLHVEREFNDVSMVCEAYMSLLAFGAAGEVYNVCSGHPHDLAEVVKDLARLSGHALKVDVNPAFVRANELHRLSGCPDKLLTLLSSHGVSLRMPSLEETLIGMLQVAKASLA
ncbi:GDP-mannose 4,6-dehydratase [Rhodoferax sp. GW822-FHT02A01]|uniref:NAD-dependent epimerase/dehydratase family protein n=1 Tax=Rhodoferax sp. GW822-FHT02A01 TaxID=3141537 RepID=UPI00315CBEBB